MESARYGDKTLLEFFKVFLINKASTQLQIPTSFTKFFNGIAPCKIILIDHDGKCWDVNLEKIEGRLVFKNGWQQFAKEKNLEEGDFLVFEYDGMSTFNVKIFSKSGCRKGATPPSREKIVPIVNLEEDSDEFSDKIQSNGIRKRSLPNPKIKVKSVLEGACPSEGARRRSKRLKEEKDKQNDKKLVLTEHAPLQNPHFQIYFDAHWRLEKVEIPKKVIKEMKIKLNRNITLRDENDRSWPLSIISTVNQDRHYFGGGWLDFKQSNNIEEGCQCDFQFVVDKANVAKELLVRVRSKGGLQIV
ncbi:hypothetical protein VNO80_29634 [Phaseolus coccineus]|uniref:TF-B3 domain-containing protein n=1 Tax=Phaseolus coccineus TaxID=3886 RepID=A0AAN9LET0_PHACN